MTEPDAIVFVVDDEAFLREALQSLITFAGYHTRTFGSAPEFLAADRPDVPACLVLDIEMPGMSGLDLQHKLNQADIRIPIIFLTGHADIPMSILAMKAGAADLLTKPFRPPVLLEAIRRAIEGDRRRRVEQAEEAQLHRKLDSLTARELQVMRLVVAGLLNKQIAAELGTSEITVKVHRARVMRKMEAESLPDLVRMADKLGIHATKF